LDNIATITRKRTTPCAYAGSSGLDSIKAVRIVHKEAAIEQNSYMKKWKVYCTALELQINCK